MHLQFPGLLSFSSPLLACNQGFPGGSGVKASAWNAGDLGSIPGSGRSPGSPGEGNSNPLQYSCLENPMEGGAQQATFLRVTKSRTDCATSLSLLACTLLIIGSVNSAHSEIQQDTQCYEQGQRYLSPGLSSCITKHLSGPLFLLLLSNLSISLGKIFKNRCLTRKT